MEIEVAARDRVGGARVLHAKGARVLRGERSAVGGQGVHPEEVAALAEAPQREARKRARMGVGVAGAVGRELR